MSKTKKIVLIVIATILVVLLGAAAYAYNLIGSTKDSELNTENISVNENVEDSSVINIAIFGVDGRVGVEGNRSDVIMIASLDTTKNTVKLTSVMRDTFCEVDTSDGTTFQKINAAYAFGGAELAVKTINQNFDMNISDYVTISFESMISIVDALGGVDVDIANDTVLAYLNNAIASSNSTYGRSDAQIDSTGVHTLNGGQALSYARIRYSDSDYQRTERQREIVQAIFNKARTSDAVSVADAIAQIFPYMKTSMSVSKIIGYAKLVMVSPDLSFSDFRVPTDEYSVSGYIDGVWYLFPNTLVDNGRALHQYIYGDDVNYEPSETVQSISDQITNYANTRTE